MSGYLLLVLVLIFLTHSAWNLERRPAPNNQIVAFALDEEDLELVSEREKIPLSVVWDKVRALPVDALVVSASDSFELEREIRKNGFKILWRENESQEPPVRSTLNRFQPGDGVLPLNDFVFGYPGMMNEVAARIVQQKGVFPIVEFGPRKGLSSLMKKTRGCWIKTHILHLEEVIDPKFNLWGSRLVRAVRERGARLLVIRLSPAAKITEELRFLSQLHQDLESRGFTVAMMTPFESFDENVAFKKIRMPLVFLLGLLGPVIVLLFVKTFNRMSPFVSFLLASAISLVTGLCVHQLQFYPEALFGLDQVRGIKLLLILPLLLGLWILLTKEERLSFLNLPLQVKHLFWGGAVLILLGGVYLMRSGNFPLISVSDGERMLRDGLENFFGARPRFKEFLFAHPLLVIGLTLQREAAQKLNFIKDGRLFILLGLIGQISIVNTFLHVHTPMEWGLLRSIHGLWLGLLISIPLYALLHKKMNGEPSI